MSSSPAPAQHPPASSPSLSSAFPRSPARDTPATPPTAPACSPHAPPTPPDSLSRLAANALSSPRSVTSPDTSSDLSLSAAFSASASQFQSRLLDTPIDIHSLAPELDSPAVLQDSAAPAERERVQAFNPREHSSPTPTQEAAARKVSPDTLPPPFIPAAARAQAALEEASGQADAASAPSPDPRPPNVYINGLPPNFPEEDLLAMTRPFGPVLSVRTFTRHVSDKPSGYGFVLFEALSSAEKCIESLRKYRNLHPSFSKQVHKIPGTTYATVPAALTSNTGPVDSFKSKMEQLGDHASTNLYMEGLPLSITEETLRALVTPYRIMSSRFFHTRLSSPPRIIAFVRLESRTAAEDIVERLHGRLVRGWNDAGCRISVRFADTAEQRELRRTERHSREGEQSPARLTMARAALLNLKGTQYQGVGHSPTLTDISLQGLPGATSGNLGLAFNQLGLGQLGSPVSPLQAASPLAIQNPFVRQGAEFGVPGLDALNARAANAPAQTLRLPQQLQDTGSGLLDDQSDLQMALLGMGVQGLRARTNNGYTPVEQLILQAHTRQQRSGAVNVGSDSVQGQLQNAQLGTSGAHINAQRAETNRRLLDFLPPMSEDDFHANAGLVQDLRSLGHTLMPTGFAASEEQLALDLDRQLALCGQPTRQRNHTLATQARSDVDKQAVHIRSSTLPSPQYTSVRSHTTTPNVPLYDSDLSLNANTSNRNTLRANTNNIHTTTHSKHAPYVPTGPSATRNIAHSLPDTQTLFSSKNNINISSATSRLNMNTSTMSSINPSMNVKNGASKTPAMSASHVVGVAQPQNGDDEDEHSPVVSPALTYSTRTPASLSPATPYSGFFADGGETFKSPNVAVAGNDICVGDVRLEANAGELKQRATGGTAVESQ
ncbi:hypothetical protein L226DRAFT_520014 [Lentinus tigrinus ALCF2SS1-7]|uniref:RRM domain-containing protein n=1 Tax=Lentinus tigrinus ALCF2SS1-6 TaxID=1328759 RepID=A0A5C2SQC3_9APHY|nr:hypothetical protein L227DRAFT_570967 [Lentinus tigrinus ALCF2SS1-6]RPD78913.1 hypothetical protein L226DRAFT_520014 [Lentinus tigrinus ALCF2SS1-7]